jgi:hypothetical protein
MRRLWVRGNQKHYILDSVHRPVFWGPVLVFSSYLDYRTADKARKRNDSECLTPSSEPFRRAPYVYPISLYNKILTCVMLVFPWILESVERFLCTRLIHKISFLGAVYRKKKKIAWKYLLQQIQQVFSFFSTYSPPELRHLSFRWSIFCVLCRRSLPHGIGTTLFWCQLLRHPPGAQFP